MTRGVAQAPLVTSIDVDESDGILWPYWLHVGRVDCAVKFNTTDLALRWFWTPDGGCWVAFVTVSIYREMFYGS